MVRDIAIKNVEEEEELYEIEDNPQRLTVGVPDISIDDLPSHHQRHTAKVSGHLGRLIHRVARAMMCYHEREDYPIVPPSFLYHISTERLKYSYFSLFICT